MGTTGVSQKKVGGVMYVFSTLTASKALRVHVALARVITEAMRSGGGRQLLGALGKKGAALADGAAPTEDAETPEDQESQMAALTNAIMSLSADDWITPDGRRMMGLETLMNTMFESVEANVNGKTVAIDLDTFFTGKGADMYRVLGHALKHNFAGFLGESRSPSAPGGAPPA